MSRFEKLLKRLGVKIQDKEYGDICSSRSVVKNRYINKDANSGFYKVDIWTAAHKRLLPYLTKGLTLYYEIVGYLPGTSTCIQKNHDYGCKEGEFAIYIYRITQTNADGVVYEFSAKQVQCWCKHYGLNSVPQLYYGRAVELSKGTMEGNYGEWEEALLRALKEDERDFNMEKPDPMCKNKVPFEGIVIRKESIDLQVFKLKCDAHYQMETKNLDSGEIDIETQETENNN